MSILRNIFSFFRLSEDESELYWSEISPDNSRRTFFLCLIAIPVSLIHIFIFSSKLDVFNGIELRWVNLIIYAHLTILILTTICSVLLFLFFYRTKKNNLFSKICTNVILVFLLVMGGVIASFDQLITSAITPFYVTTMIVGLIFLIRPFFSVLYFTASYLFFSFAIAHTQLNSEILLSNQLNGLSITAVGLSLSFILWRSNLTKIKQKIQIVRQNKALTDSIAEKDKFFSIIAHDLKSPFNAILGFSNLLTKQVGEKNFREVEEYAEYIQQSSKSAMDLLTNLMEWSKAHTGKMDFKPDNFKLNDLILESEQLFSGAVFQKKLNLTTNVPADTIVFADKNMIRTLLRNLISNAIKFTQPDGSIIVAVQNNKDEVLVSVRDTGIGIPKDSINKLFRIDQNYSTPGTQREMGTGLGLILCKELIEKHDGKIWGESELGVGSTFYFSLPNLKS